MAKFAPQLLSEECFGTGDYPCDDTYSPKTGKIIVPVSGRDTSYFLLSDDNGCSFRKEARKDSRHEKYRELSDGTFLALGFPSLFADKFYDYDTKEDIPFGLCVYRANSIEDILNNRVTADFVTLNIPGLTFGYGDSGNRHTGCVSGWRELSNGDIYVTMYGQFRDDTTLCPYFRDNSDYDFYLYRTWAVVSHDKGKTWEYVTTLADCQTYPIPDVNAEGYCEADIEETSPGHIVCILRTQGHEIFSPMYVSHSDDYGKTWSSPSLMCDWGVFPRLLKMQDGTLVCASGHWHTMLLFSEDGGNTWSEPFIVEPCDGLWDKSATGYTSVYESKPGEITIIYADPKEGIAENAPDGKKRKVYRKTFRIDKA